LRYWLTSQDPDFTAKRDRVVALYRNPPCCAEVICVDEKTSIQALERLHPDIPACRRWRRRQEFEYVRHGTVHLLAGFNVRTGRVTADVLLTKNTSTAFIRFLKRLLAAYPGRTLYLVLDNGSTHKSRETKAFLRTEPRLVPVYLPTHASWLNQVEIWFSVLSRQMLRGASFTSRKALRCQLLTYVRIHNRHLAHAYDWSTKGKPLCSGRKNTRGAVKALLRSAKRRAIV
jgi:transposase